MKSLKQRMPAGEQGGEGKCLRQVQRIMWKWGENTFKSSLGGEAECSLHPGYGNANLLNISWMLFRLVLNTLEAEAGNYWQTRFVWPAQCFKQFWIYCQHCTNWEISFLFKCSLFLENWKLKELEKPATWQHYRAGARQQLLTFLRHVLPGSPQGPPARFTHQITCKPPAGICISHPSFKEWGQKSVSLCFSISSSHKKSYFQDRFLPQGC